MIQPVIVKIEFSGDFLSFRLFLPASFRHYYTRRCGFPLHHIFWIHINCYLYPAALVQHGDIPFKPVQERMQGLEIIPLYQELPAVLVP